MSDTLTMNFREIKLLKSIFYMITQVCPIQGCALRLKLISSNKSSYLARIEIRVKR